MQESLDASTLSMDMDDPESTLHAKRELTGAGQNGSELSGGQQARVALARCFYAGKKTSLRSTFCTQMIVSRQARDKHRETSRPTRFAATQRCVALNASSSMIRSRRWTQLRLPAAGTRGSRARSRERHACSWSTARCCSALPPTRR